MDFIQESYLDPLSNVLYSYVLIYLLLGVGLYFTIQTRGVQFRYFTRMVRQLGSSREGAAGGISSFQAFCVGLASRVGTGNIAGVAIALTLGGAGAIFWMWVVAAVGMASAFVEATLAQIFTVIVLASVGLGSILALTAVWAFADVARCATTHGKLLRVSIPCSPRRTTQICVRSSRTASGRRDNETQQPQTRRDPPELINWYTVLVCQNLSSTVRFVTRSAT